MTQKAHKEDIQFKAEVSQVLNLVINSLYTHKEVFLRELISNAADAIDKAKHLSLSDETLSVPAAGYRIQLIPDKKAKTLSIRDNGVGMTREEMIANLGTIASSGTKAFLEQLKSSGKEAPNLIGQFGVGFYSAFMVASEVQVRSKKAGSQDPATLWSSDGMSGYHLEDVDKQEHGTEIVLQLKDDALDYAEDFTLKTIVKKYSDYVSYPIELIDENEKAETINKVTAIWRRPKNEIKPEEYAEFYKYISHDLEDPLLYTHHTIEGVMEFRLLLFIPKKAPVNLYREDIRGLRLHVRKMFVTDECKDLLPVYLRFVKGVVDSEDLPLNVSRETLQGSAVIPKIRQQLTKRIFDLLEETAKNAQETYEQFFNELGIALKEGLTSDFENRDRILKLLRFKSNKTKENEWISLEEYKKRMKPDQKDIYYLIAPDIEACRKSAHLEFFEKKDIEVLFMTDVIDEWAAPAIGEFDGVKVKAINKGDLDLGELGKEAALEKEKAEKDFKLVQDRVRSALQDNVKEVRLSIRLSESPCCLVSEEGDMDPHMRQMMQAMGQEVPETKRILELNPEHAIIKNMKSLLDKDPKDEKVKEWSQILYEEALLKEGQALKDPAAFVKKINVLLEKVTQQN